jgi:hypothetical protein
VAAPAGWLFNPGEAGPSNSRIYNPTALISNGSTLISDGPEVAAVILATPAVEGKEDSNRGRNRVLGLPSTRDHVSGGCRIGRRRSKDQGLPRGLSTKAHDDYSNLAALATAGLPRGAAEVPQVISVLSLDTHEILGAFRPVGAPLGHSASKHVDFTQYGRQSP